MTINEYQAACMRTCGKPDLVNGILGLCGEAGECADMVKKHMYQGHSLNTNDLLHELGDVAWYIAVAAQALGCNLETVLLMNVEKLKKRYPDGFDADKSINRTETK